MPQHYLADLTAQICELYETRISSIAWKKLKRDYEEEFKLPFPYLEEKHERYIEYLEKYVECERRKKFGEWYDITYENTFKHHLKFDHPDFAELKAHNYV